MKIARKLLWVVVIVALIGTCLPYLGLVNAPVFWGPFPEPLALTLLCNVALTLCVVAIYPLYFRPFMRALQRRPIEDIE